MTIRKDMNDLIKLIYFNSIKSFNPPYYTCDTCSKLRNVDGVINHIAKNHKHPKFIRSEEVLEFLEKYRYG
jgi:hypothetical protein